LLDSLLQERHTYYHKMSERDAWISTLQDMGFGPNRSNRALKATDYKGVEPAMEWLLANSDNDALDDPLSEDEAPPALKLGGAPTEADNPSSEPKKPLTEEERREKMAKMEELRIKKRAEREEKEKQEALERERKRIEDGKSMTDIKQKLEEQEIKKMAELKRREKMEEKAAKARVLQQIEEDKIARRAKFNMKTPEGAGGSSESVPAAPTPVAIASPAPKKDYTETRIQIRQPSGQPIVHAFGVKEQLAAVRLYAQINRTDGGDTPFRLMTNFPKKVFNEEDYENSLENLGLVPSAVLMMTK